MNSLPLIVIELVLVFGGALAFAWWQLSDLARERKKREQAQRDNAPGEPRPGVPRAAAHTSERQPSRTRSQEPT
jgi:hypothetical protein